MFDIENAKYKWSVPGLFKADPDQVAQEIYEIGDQLSPQEIVDYARNEETELHKCFEWDNNVAAEKYRCQQARNIMRCLVVVDQEKPKENKKISIAYRTDGSRSYETTRYIVANEDSYFRLLRTALRELAAFRAKYKAIAELGKVFEAIDALAS